MAKPSVSFNQSPGGSLYIATSTWTESSHNMRLNLLPTEDYRLDSVKLTCYKDNTQQQHLEWNDLNRRYSDGTLRLDTGGHSLCNRMEVYVYCSKIIPLRMTVSDPGGGNTAGDNDVQMKGIGEWAYFKLWAKAAPGYSFIKWEITGDTYPGMQTTYTEPNITVGLLSVPQLHSAMDLYATAYFANGKLLYGSAGKLLYGAGGKLLYSG